MNGNSLEELEDTKDNVVDVAEARRFALLRVVQATGPVDSNVGLVAVQFRSTSCKTRPFGVCVRGRE